MTDLIIKLFKRAAISTVDRQDLYLQLRSHHDYPSLKAITDTLDYFGIENIAANVPKDALSQLPKSFLGLIEKENANQLVFVSCANELVTIIDESGKKEKISETLFQDIWTGTIIAIEVPENIQSNWRPKLSATVLVTMLIIGTAIASIFINGLSLSQSLYFLLSIVGLGISYLILKESQGEGSSITAKVCNTISTNINGCGAVINNTKGKLSKNIGLGDLSLMFFASTFFVCTILGVNASIFLIVASLTIPVVVYAIYSQAFVIKDWCFLCIGIAAILISQFVVLANAFTDWDFSLAYVFNAISLTLLITISWLVVKPLLSGKKKLQDVQKDFLNLKRDENVFETLLQANVVDNLIEVPEDAKIHFGNRQAALQLTAYTNPLCGFCTEAFEGYDTLLSQFPDDVGISFVFNTPNDKDNPGTKISKKIIELYDADSKKAWQGLKDWFAIKDINAWQDIYGTNSSMLLRPDNILETHRVIVGSNNINYTPETLIGTAKLSREYYSYNDIALFINYFKEKNKNTIVLEAV